MRKIDLKKELKKLKKQKQVKEKDVLNLQRALAQNKDIFPSKVEVLELLRRVGIKDYVKKKPMFVLSQGREFTSKLFIWRACCRKSKIGWF